MIEKSGGRCGSCPKCEKTATKTLWKSVFRNSPMRSPHEEGAIVHPEGKTVTKITVSGGGGYGSLSYIPADSPFSSTKSSAIVALRSAYASCWWMLSSFVCLMVTSESPGR